jgi:hypothetical protein
VWVTTPSRSAPLLRRRVAKTAPSSTCATTAWRTAVAIVAFARDREIRVLAAPLDPAGRIRGDVIEDRQVELLGERARSPHAATRMAFRVACSEHSTAALALTFRVACSQHSTAVLALAFRVVWSATSIMCPRLCARTPRLRARPRTLCAGGCARGRREVSGRSEGETRRVMAVVRAATQLRPWWLSRLP